MNKTLLEIIKVDSIVTAAVTLSFTDVEHTLRIITIALGVLYTGIKIIKELKNKNNP